MPYGRQYAGYDVPQSPDPGAYIAQTWGNISSSLKDFIRSNQQWQEQKRQAGSDLVAKQQFYNNAVQHIKDTGADLNEIQLPDPNDESVDPDEFAARVTQALKEHPIISQKHQSNISSATETSKLLARAESALATPFGEAPRQYTQAEFMKKFSERPEVRNVPTEELQTNIPFRTTMGSLPTEESIYKQQREQRLSKHQETQLKQKEHSDSLRWLELQLKDFQTRLAQGNATADDLSRATDVETKTEVLQTDAENQAKKWSKAMMDADSMDDNTWAISYGDVSKDQAKINYEQYLRAAKSYADKLEDIKIKKQQIKTMANKIRSPLGGRMIIPGGMPQEQPQQPTKKGSMF